MRIVVVGGKGRVGSRLCTLLEGAGHEVVAASPSTGVDTVTGVGLEAALRHAHVVTDVSNPRAWGDAEVRDFFRTSTSQLLAAGTVAGVQHHVVLSVVGCELAGESAYLRAKAEQERAVESGPIPHTILRATQFFEFIVGIVEASTVDDVVRLPAVDFQPVGMSDVAAVLAELIVGAPRGRVELAGPERLKMSDAARRVLAAKKDGRRVVDDDRATYFGARLEQETLVPHGDAQLGCQHLDEWLRDQGPNDG